MKRSRNYIRLGIFCLIVLTLLVAQGCQGELQTADGHTIGGKPAGTQPSVRDNGQHAPMRRFFFLDLSGSVSDEQRISWLQETRKILSRLGAGDSLLVFGVHEATRNADPIYVGHIPTPANNGMGETIRIRQAIKEVRQLAGAKIEEALKGKGAANKTDLFQALDRIRPDENGRPTEVFFFSDMLQSSAEFDAERTPLAKNMTGVIRSTIERHGWRKEHLDKMKVYCVLPGSRGQSNINDRQVLEKFWGSLVQSLGGRIVNFETYLVQY